VVLEVLDDDHVYISGAMDNFSQGEFRCKGHKSLFDKEYLKLEHNIV
jgi:hypothetical protein